MMYLREIAADIRAARKARKEDKGAGFVEYGAIILLVAGIVAAVWTLDVPNTIAKMVNGAVGDVQKEAEADPGGGDNEDKDKDKDKDKDEN